MSRKKQPELKYIFIHANPNMEESKKHIEEFIYNYVLKKLKESQKIESE